MTGQELRKRRESMLLTQEELAQRLGVAANTVARWEREERGIPALLRRALADVEDELAADPTWTAEHNQRMEARMRRELAEAEANPPMPGSAEREWFEPH